MHAQGDSNQQDSAVQGAGNDGVPQLLSRLSGMLNDPNISGMLVDPAAPAPPGRAELQPAPRLFRPPAAGIPGPPGPAGASSVPLHTFPLSSMQHLPLLTALTQAAREAAKLWGTEWRPVRQVKEEAREREYGSRVRAVLAVVFSCAGAHSEPTVGPQRRGVLKRAEGMGLLFWIGWLWCLQEGTSRAPAASGRGTTAAKWLWHGWDGGFLTAADSLTACRVVASRRASSTCRLASLARSAPSLGTSPTP